MNQNRILLADNNINYNTTIKNFFEERKFTVFTTTDGQEAFKIIVTQKPKLALVEMMLPRMNALQMLHQHRKLSQDQISTTKIVVMSSQTNVDNIKECIRLGAADFLLKPMELEEIVPRIVYHLQNQRKNLTSIEGDDTNGQLYLQLIEMVLEQISVSESIEDSLYRITHLCAMALKSIRASVIQCVPNQKGIVRGSSDDPDARPWILELRKYPEILTVLSTGKTQVIENLNDDPNMAEVKRSFTNIQFNSMIVTPIFIGKEDFFGVLTIRMPANRTQIDDFEVRFAQILAQITGITLRMFTPRDLAKSG